MDTLKSFKDYYPLDFLKRDKLLELLKNTSNEFGYIPYDGPIIESQSLYELKSGEGIMEEVYSFRDKGGRDVVLRPEMTPTLSRMIAKKSKSLKKPLRWYSIPTIFRYERSQKGRSREFIQYNADIIGENSSLAEIEIIDLCMSILEKLGFLRDDFDILVNDRTFICEYISSLTSNVSEILYIIDHKDKIDKKEFLQNLEKILKNKEKVNKIIKFLENTDYKKSDNLKDLFTKSLNFNLKLSYNPYLVRGFDYYTGIVFEIWDKKRKIQRSIFGGGRYSDLISNMGGDNISACGSATSDTILFALMEEYNKKINIDITYDYFISVFPNIEYSIYYKIANTLRKRGYSVLLNINPSWSITKQLEFALSQNVEKFIITGEKELKNNELIVKDLKNHKEKIIKLNDL